MKNHLILRATLASAGALVLSVLVGCSSNPGSLKGDDGVNDPNNPNGGDPGGANGGDPNGTGSTTQACDVGMSYDGFAGVKLEVGRVDAAIGADRARMKPYSALQGEYQRVLGNTPGTLAGAASTFGQPPARWYVEPLASAISLYTAYSVAFDGCLTYTATDPQYGAAPTQATATQVCTAMARKFWSQTPTPDQVNACVTVAVTNSATITDARRRWAHTCASVMTASGFLAY